MSKTEVEKEDQREYPRTVTIYKNGRFIQWLTKEKTLLFYSREPSDFHSALWTEWGPYSSIAASAVMIIAKEYGTSLGPTVKPEDLIIGNALGENLKELTLDEILKKFVMEGLPKDLPATIGTIKMSGKKVDEEHDEWARKMVQKEIEEHKQKMVELGFPFET